MNHFSQTAPLGPWSKNNFGGRRSLNKLGQKSHFSLVTQRFMTHEPPHTHNNNLHFYTARTHTPCSKILITVIVITFKANLYHLSPLCRHLWPFHDSLDLGDSGQQMTFLWKCWLHKLKLSWWHGEMMPEAVYLIWFLWPREEFFFILQDKISILYILHLHDLKLDKVTQRKVAPGFKSSYNNIKW